MKLNSYVTLGRTGLAVSPLCLGTMTFGTEWGWGADLTTSGQLLDLYLETGGNFIDTADLYTGGKSEEILGELIQDRGARDQIVIATKFTFNAQPDNPNAGGNGRKNAYRALEGSLRRLKTDYIDLYWMHAWDTVTPVEEVMRTFDDLVRSGKVRYVGFSDVPAWYAARAQTLAEKEGKELIAALQLEYSLVERSIEREHITAAQVLGMGLCPWSPLASGFLTGKYRRDETDVQGRLSVTKGSGNPTLERFSDRNWRILDELLVVAKEVGRSPAEVALNWVATQSGVTSTIIGATKPVQLKSNLSAIEFEIPASLRARLHEASKLDTAHPYVFYEDYLQKMIHGNASVRAWQP
jgi:aryl-alcohol dehydrogenase-like predicted oxidoreductase